MLVCPDGIDLSKKFKAKEIFINVTTRKDQSHIVTIGYDQQYDFEDKYDEFIKYIRDYPNRAQEFKVLFCDLDVEESYAVYKSLKRDLADLYQIVQYSTEDFGLHTEYEFCPHIQYCRKLVLFDQHSNIIPFHEQSELFEKIDSCNCQKLYLQMHYYQLCLGWGICDELNQVIKNYIASPIIDAWQNISNIGIILNRKSNSELLLKDI